ncbi:hypothetical protein [Alkaliphilus metalliredigens]|uniref:hypothetical protein n=1 Tax=Alkaliphilus metalliredigens TaxID=208226 RepID=UPI0018DC50A0|nr:hypothetical protein [Alkaliphilus metalliredigens]
MILLLTLFDLPFLLQSKQKRTLITYYSLVTIGIITIYIILMDLPIDSPVVVIEDLINFITER